jgi:GNAT superfamily N-acetyltransferase
MLFAEVDARSVGMCAWWQVNSDGEWIGFSVGYVMPDYRRRGIGRNLLDFNRAASEGDFRLPGRNRQLSASPPPLPA